MRPCVPIPDILRQFALLVAAFTAPVNTACIARGDVKSAPDLTGGKSAARRTSARGLTSSEP
jgi:hypothetical protein